uniref:Uncharacterized protein n=1 Tax=Arion vulgaris TaxID=1028688 RepID=A0A0B7APR2_9EUPU
MHEKNISSKTPPSAVTFLKYVNVFASASFWFPILIVSDYSRLMFSPTHWLYLCNLLVISTGMLGGLC